MKTSRIYAFGDSLVTGTYDVQGGWCDRLKRDMHRITNEASDGTKRQMYNLGIGGETSRGLALRIRAELSARHQAQWPAVVLIGTGKNDSRLNSGHPEVPIDEYADNLRLIIATAREITDRIIMVGIGPCADEEITFKDFTYSRSRLAEYDDVMTSVAQEQHVKKIALYELLQHATKDVFYRDKLHLNDQGYELAYEAIKPVLMDMLEQEN